MKPKCMIFDFDYTLADSSRGAIECAAYALEQLGFTVPSDDTIRKTIGLSLNDTFDYLAGEMPDPPHAEFTRHFVEMADRIMLDRIVLFPETRQLLEVLNQQGIPAGIVSTKYHYRIQAFLAREDLADAFSVIVGGEEVAAHKPDPSGLLMALEQLECTPDETLYVGDSVTDAETARRASVPFVAVLTGVTTMQDFFSYEPLAILQNLTHIPALWD